MDLSRAEEITTLTFNEICRLCFTKKSRPTLSPIFSNSILHKLTSVVPIEMHEGDGLPATICEECCREVDRSYNFQLQCQSSDEALRQCIFPTTTVKSRPEIPSTNRPTTSTEVTQYKPEALVQKSHSTETLSPHKTHATTMDTQIVCNVESPDGKSLPVSVMYPKNKIIIKPLKKLPIDENKIDEKPRFTPCRPQVITIFRPKKPSIRPPTESRPKSFSCNMCSKSFAKRSHLSSHQVVHKGEKPFLCEECGKAFARQQELNNHIDQHSGINLYSCDLCNKTFISMSGFKSHQDAHNGVRPFLCITCGKTFRSKTSMMNHERIHSQEKPFYCTLCDKHFTTSSNLHTHQKRHTGIIRFSCTTCNKPFFTKSGLDRHELVHSGLKAFTCEICSLSFFTKTEISRHMRYHRGEKRFNCDVCFKSFIEKQHLIIHKRIHSGERPYSCKLCQKSFYSTSKLSRHMKTKAGHQH